MVEETYKDLCKLDLPWDMLREKSVLVTGANGMIASSFIDALFFLNDRLKLEVTIYALCRSGERGKMRFQDYIDREDFQLIVQDVIEPLDCVNRYDFIIHAASSAHPIAFNNMPVDVIKANIIGTMNILDYVTQRKGARLLFVSSSEVYGENRDEKPVFFENDEGCVNFTRFRACYPEGKRAAETMCYCYNQQFGTDFVIVRPAFIFGRNILQDNTRVDVYCMNQILNGNDIVMYSSGEQIRQYCYITDCISGMLFALLKGTTGEVYNIGNMDCVVSLREYAEKLAEVANVKVLIDKKRKPADRVFLKTTKCILDTSKLESLGWTAQYSLETGIKEIINCKQVN